MFKKIKFLLLLLIVIVVSGCDAEYNITIHENLAIEEKITFMEKNDAIYLYTSSINGYIDSFIIQMGDQYSVDNYDVKKEIGDTVSGIEAVRPYNDFESLTENNILIGEIYDEMSMNIDDYNNLVELNFKSINKRYEIFYGDLHSDALLSNINIVIELPYEVVRSNADSIDKTKNRYTWYYDKDVAYKDVEIIFDKGKLVKNNFFDELLSSFKGGNYLTYLVIGGIVFLIFIAGLYVIARINHNNSI